MASIFTKIIRGEIPSYKIFEDHLSFAFLDIRPHNLGHTLLVPKEEIPNFTELPDNIRDKIFSNAQKISKAILVSTGCLKVGLMIHGMGIPEHFHLHLVPLLTANDMDQAKAHEEPEPEMQKIAEKIKQNLKN